MTVATGAAYASARLSFTTTVIDPTVVSQSELIDQVNKGFYHAAYILPVDAASTLSESLTVSRRHMATCMGPTFLLTGPGRTRRNRPRMPR